jgi:peptidoglycan L-alanyl-D-glutamate endopeptidase CwlK
MILPPLTVQELVRRATLQPQLIAKFELFRTAAWNEFTMILFLAQATRTFDQQAALYAQGRTRDGSIVTYARPGHSWHNFGLAFDIALRKPILVLSEKIVLFWEIPEKLGALGESLGLEWGNRWKHADENHFQLVGDMDVARAALRWPDGWPLLAG